MRLEGVGTGNRDREAGVRDGRDRETGVRSASAFWLKPPASSPQPT